MKSGLRLPSLPLRILYVATKPAFPPRDGGRLLMWHTIVGLASRGHEITFVAPDLNRDHRKIERHLSPHCFTLRLVEAQSKGRGLSLVRAVATGRPFSIVRHSHPAVQRQVAMVLSHATFDVIHVEQTHALANLPISRPLPPIVLRAQNVESQLWRMVARVKPRAAWLARREARRMAGHEAQAVSRAAATVSLTRHDGAILGGALGMEARRIHVIPPPFPSSLEVTVEPLAGDPAIVLVAGGWLPNRDSTDWFFASIWNEIRRVMPSARVHVYGGNGPKGYSGISWQQSPPDSISIFRRSSILVVPLRIASGIRMKILEAWARGVPTVATPEAVRGLGGSHGNEFLLASNGPEFAAAIHRLHREPDLRQRLIESGRSALKRRHDPREVVSMLERTYCDAAANAPPVT